uniref:hypothetical protein n=1 Tax=Shewanella sp. TaxID=50422 RepID=UPI004047F6A6
AGNAPTAPLNNAPNSVVILSQFSAGISPCVRIVVASVFHKNKTGSGKLVMSEALPRRAQASCH